MGAIIKSLLQHKSLLYVLGIWLAVVVLFGGAQQVSAHQIVSGGDVTAVVHITPNDDPVAGTNELSNIAFDTKGVAVNNRSHNLSLVFTQPDGTVQNLIPYVLEDGVISLAIQFQQVGEYTFVLSGEPIDGGEPFRIVHTQQVARSASDDPLLNGLVLPLAVLAAALVIASSAYIYKRYS